MRRATRTSPRWRATRPGTATPRRSTARRRWRCPALLSGRRPTPDLAADPGRLPEQPLHAAGRQLRVARRGDGHRDLPRAALREPARASPPATGCGRWPRTSASSRCTCCSRSDCARACRRSTDVRRLRRAAATTAAPRGRGSRDRRPSALLNRAGAARAPARPASSRHGERPGFNFAPPRAAARALAVPAGGPAVRQRGPDYPGLRRRVWTTEPVLRAARPAASPAPGGLRGPAGRAAGRRAFARGRHLRPRAGRHHRRPRRQLPAGPAAARPDPGDLSDIAGVPLFIKYPDQRHGRDRRHDGAHASTSCPRSPTRCSVRLPYDADGDADSQTGTT